MAPPSSRGEFPRLLEEALKVAGLNQSEATHSLEISQSLVSKMLRGHTVSERTAALATDWAREILEERETVVVSAASHSPYETVLRGLLEKYTQDRLEELAGSAAEGVRVRVTLDWERPAP